ncbi:MAG: SUF system Fe-S cluster assembly protein [Dongiaceae bacterium]
MTTEPNLATEHAAPAPPPAMGATQDREALREAIVAALHTIYDPEIPVDIYELGLIYDLQIEDNGDVHVTMTLTAPGCPVAGSMPGTVEETVAGVEGVGKVTVELVWDPPWDQSRMSEAARLELGFF